MNADIVINTAILFCCRWHQLLIIMNYSNQYLVSSLLSLGSVWHNRSEGKRLFYLLGLYWSAKRKAMARFGNNCTFYLKLCFTHIWDLSVFLLLPLFVSSPDSHSLKFKLSIRIAMFAWNLDGSLAFLWFSHTSRANIYDVLLKCYMGTWRGTAPLYDAQRQQPLVRLLQVCQASASANWRSARVNFCASLLYKASQYFITSIAFSFHLITLYVKVSTGAVLH